MTKLYTSDKGDPTTSVTATLPEEHYSAFLFLTGHFQVSNSELLRHIVAMYLEYFIGGLPKYIGEMNNQEPAKKK